LEITKAGTYYFYADNGINLYYLDYKEKIALGNEVGFSIGTTAVKSYYLTGDAFSSDGLTVDLAYSSGFAFPAEDMTKVKVDSSAFNKDKAGDYDIKVQYGSYDPQTFKVSVHAVKSIVLYHSPLQASSGKTDVNRTPDVYKVGAVFSSNYLVVKAVADDNKELTVSSATFGAVDLTTAGVKEVKASYINEGVTYTDSFNVTAIDPSLLVASASGSYKVTVNPALTQDGTVDSTTSVMGFKTIQAANDFLAAKAEATAKKEIAVADGTYNEKLYITIPNVSLASASADASKVVVQFDADEDTKDAGGLPFGTACGSVVINSSAKNFSAANITFNNSKFATMAEYTACTDGNKQAIALSCEGDMSAFSHCVFKGFQDTLYAKGAKDSTDTTNTGHQYYNACTISGMTDFIFGDESDCYFKGCTIKCLNRSDAKNGGYICTTKAAAKRTIGFVFDTCTVTPEEGVTDGTVSLGRTWGAGATIKYVNCTLPKAISVSAYPCSTNNARWEAMSGNLPTAAFFTEYNNSGEGAITAAVAGGSLMSDTDYTTLQAAIQTAFSSILA
jgi:pectin methylesterase-like acyl-CoA thioesterase